MKFQFQTHFPLGLQFGKKNFIINQKKEIFTHFYISKIFSIKKVFFSPKKISKTR